jgi:A/G-specific adenine glycosylase
MPASIAHLSDVQQALLRWHDGAGLHAPWRTSGDPYECLVAAVMAQQTQMSRVMECYDRFTAAYPTLETLAQASLGDVIRTWRGMGYNQRAVRLHRAARQLARRGWPRDAATLATLDGIGPFTAAIVASFAFGEPAACVDTNVRRVLGRLAGDESITATALQRLADESIAEAPARWNQAVMDYGARVCTPRPKCGECVLASWCPSRRRYATPRAAEERGRYRAAPRRAEQPFEGSPRYFRGRIIDALRDLPTGQSITLGRLSRVIANGHAPPGDNDIRLYVDALVKAGLAEVHGGRVSLPE